MDWNSFPGSHHSQHCRSDAGASNLHEEDHHRSQRLVVYSQGAMRQIGSLLGRLEKLSVLLDAVDAGAAPQDLEKTVTREVKGQGRLNSSSIHDHRQTFPVKPMKLLCNMQQEDNFQPVPGNGSDTGPPERLSSNVQADEQRDMPRLFGDVYSSSPFPMPHPDMGQVRLPSTSVSSSSATGGRRGQRELPLELNLDSNELLDELRSYMMQLDRHDAKGAKASRSTQPAQSQTANDYRPGQEGLSNQSEHLKEQIVSSSPPSYENTPCLEVSSLPSLGSSGHFTGACKPCLFWYRQMCLKGDQCDYCHIPHDLQEVKKVRPSKATRTLLQQRETRFERESSV